MDAEIKVPFADIPEPSESVVVFVAVVVVVVVF